ncbi:hypothetical protein [Pedobacter gandavensis]|uniref:hypothetical protein n=1 Tax=Pedobacter gandavensis TaxID=2679963 RepID=UPI002930EE2B|nr:hypothetical protein [Pedobacter gandavensis]
MVKEDMKVFSEYIYYLDKEVSDKIAIDFALIDQSGFYELYQYKIDKTYWRLEKADKYQVQFLVRMESLNDWVNFDSRNLEIGLLLKTRGNSIKKCIWAGCGEISLQRIVYCELHAYLEMGIRK